MSRSASLPLLAAVAAVLAALLGVLLLAPGGAVKPPSDDPPPGAALSEDDRLALDAPDVRRGADAAPVDPAVDLADPEAVARAFLVAAHSVTAADAGSTHMRAAGYAVPGTAPSAVGELVLDPPSPGSVRAASVRALELVAADGAGGRRGYLAAVETATGPPGDAVEVDLVTSHVVLARQADGRWLVSAANPPTPDLPAGEG